MSIANKVLIEKTHFGPVYDLLNNHIGDYLYIDSDRQDLLDSILNSLSESFLKKEFLITLDLETIGLDPRLGYILLVSICVDGTTSLVFPYFWVNKDSFYNFLRTVKLSNHNLPFDYKWLIHHTKIVPELYTCSLQQARFAYAGMLKEFGLDKITKQLFNYKLDKTVRLPFSKCSQDSRFTLQQIAYAASDSIVTYKTIVELDKRVFNEKITSIWENHDRPLIPIFSLSSYIGLKVNKDSLLEQYQEGVKSIKDKSAKYVDQYNALPADKKDVSITEFKISSNKSAIHLFGSQGFHTTSLAKEIVADLYKLNPESEFLRDYIAYKEEFTFVTKFLKTNVEKLNSPEVNLRIHPDFATNGTETGRLSAKGPNVMAFSGKARKLIQADEDCYIVSCDLSAYEFRAVAAKTGEPILLQAFADRAKLYPHVHKLGLKFGYVTPDDFIKDVLEKNKFLDQLSDIEVQVCKAFFTTDIHRVNASRMFNVEPFNVTSIQRKVAKTLGYAVLYGSGANTIMEQLMKEGIKLTLKECLEFIDKFYALYPRIKASIAECHKLLKIPDAESTDYRTQYSLRTELGRKRYFTYPPKYLGGIYKRSLAEAERAGFNYYFQGANADGVKLAVIKLEEYYASLYEKTVSEYRDINWIINEKDYSVTRFMLTVHDELVSQVHKDHLEEVLKVKPRIITECSDLTVNHKVPMEVSISYGLLWDK